MTVHLTNILAGGATSTAIDVFFLRFLLDELPPGSGSCISLSPKYLYRSPIRQALGTFRTF